MAAVTVSRSGDRLIAVKEVPAHRADEVEREAELLRRLDHPGLVSFVDIVETPDGGRALHTEFVSSDTWATRPLTDPAERAAGMAALAAVVADLHQLGVAHMRITPPHVLHGPGDQPVLCGLAMAEEATPENTQRDLAALGELCHDSSLGRGALAGKLSDLADSARTGMLSARELSRRLDLLAGKKANRANPVRAAGRGRAATLAARLRPRSLILAGGLVIALAAAFVLGSRSQAPAPIGEPSSPAGDHVVAAPDAAPAAELTGGQVEPAGEPDRGHSEPRTGERDPAGELNPSGEPDPGEEGEEIAVLAPPGAPTTLGLGDEPDPPAAVAEPAAVLEHRGRRYAVGVVGDFVETGDWDCDGVVTAAIVRPSTGGVVMFDVWPDPGATITLPARWQVDLPTGAEAVSNGQCDLLRIYTTTGSQLFSPDDVS